MKIKIIIALVVLISLLAGGVVFAQDPQPPEDASAPQEESVVYQYVETSEPKSPSIEKRNELAVYGINWFPEIDKKFTTFKRAPSGTKTMVKLAGKYYVDIAIPLVTHVEFYPQYINLVEFCGYSSKGAKTKPVSWELWSFNKKFWGGAITWPANNYVNCVYKSFQNPVMKEDLLARVYVNYKNTTHKFTFLKASVRTAPVAYPPP